MASLVKKSRGPRVRCSRVDRLSHLPDDIIHRILSSLDFLDVVRTCVLSKRWRDVWVSTPFLNFNKDWFSEHNGGSSSTSLEQRVKFWDFVKWALLLRDASRIRRISLSSDDTRIDQLNGLLRVAARLRVPEICFHDGDSAAEELEFPRVLCETLTALTVDFRDNIPLRFATIFKNLRSLFLRGTIISSDAVQKLLSSNCVKLENVHLEDCQIRDLDLITVSAHNLKNLTIVNVSGCGDVWILSSFDYQLSILAPNLVSFSYVGPMLRGFALVNTESLRHASIRILRVPQKYEDAWGRKDYLPYATKFVGLERAESLTLSSVVVKYFSPAHGGHLEVPFILDKLNCLKLGLRYNLDSVEGLVKLLKLSPNLEVLVIRFKEDQQISWLSRKSRRATPRGCIWELRNEDVACLSYHVKNVEIINFDGSALALSLVKFLLQNGKVLEQMKIMQITGERKVKNLMKLKTFPKASSKAVISFTEYPQTEFPWFDRGDSDPEDD